jgi:hypothetical protein
MTIITITIINPVQFRASRTRRSVDIRRLFFDVCVGCRFFIAVVIIDNLIISGF